VFYHKGQRKTVNRGSRHGICAFKKTHCPGRYLFDHRVDPDVSVNRIIHYSLRCNMMNYQNEVNNYSPEEHAMAAYCARKILINLQRAAPKGVRYLPEKMECVHNIYLNHLARI
jgi:hypothetical protein